MSVIAELRIASSEFELGRVLGDIDRGRIELDLIVPLEERFLPYLRLKGVDGDAFEAALAREDSVARFDLIDDFGESRLYSFDWDNVRDRFFRGITQLDAQLLQGNGTSKGWTFQIRFPDHQALSQFKDYCDTEALPIEVRRIFNPTQPETRFTYGMSEVQLETLRRAVEAGYYSIPRGISTVELAEEFGISDQSVIERLRRAITGLVEHTVIGSSVDESQRDLMPELG